jgi:hypothetical protein
MRRDGRSRTPDPKQVIAPHHQHQCFRVTLQPTHKRRGCHLSVLLQQRDEKCFARVESGHCESPPLCEGAFCGQRGSSDIEQSVQDRTPILLRFLVTLPSVEAMGRWRERGRVGRRSPSVGGSPAKATQSSVGSDASLLSSVQEPPEGPDWGSRGCFTAGFGRDQRQPPWIRVVCRSRYRPALPSSRARGDREVSAVIRPHCSFSLLMHPPCGVPV